MALGGGTFISQNKVLPGAYINFVSAAAAKANLSERGYAAVGLSLDWGPEGKVFEVTQEDFQKNSRKIFGHAYGEDSLKGLRDLFLNIHTLYAYRLNSGGKKASCDLAEARYGGTLGNTLKIVVQKNVDDTNKFDVSTYLGTALADIQTVSAASELKANDYVAFKTDAELSVSAGIPLEGGTNGVEDASSHQAFLEKIESYPQVNAIGYVGTEDTIKSLYAAFTKRMRDNVGIKFQAVLYNKAADYEGCVNVKNKVLDSGADESSLVYWVTGVVAGTAVNKSATNKTYDGEFEINADYTQIQLENAIKAGEFTFHRVGPGINVLSDINSLVGLTEDKGEVFQSNQTVRVCDQIATDIASVFGKKYSGKIPNDADGRISLWHDIVKQHQELQRLRAIEDFSETDVKVEKGETKKSVVVTDVVTVVNAMEKLYMKVTVA